MGKLHNFYITNLPNYALMQALKPFDATYNEVEYKKLKKRLFKIINQFNMIINNLNITYK